jgi:hypothetical protein
MTFAEYTRVDEIDIEIEIDIELPPRFADLSPQRDTKSFTERETMHTQTFRHKGTQTTQKGAFATSAKDQMWPKFDLDLDLDLDIEIEIEIELPSTLVDGCNTGKGRLRHRSR